jgi:phosphoenolpyruvate carboxykinase (GTP)
MPERASKLPRIFHVNWFRKGADGKFLWPGFGDNMRVLEWILNRCDGKVGARETAIGLLPLREDLNLASAGLDAQALDQLLEVDPEGWRKEFVGIGEYLHHFHDRLPDRLRQEHARVSAALAAERAAHGSTPAAA